MHSIDKISEAFNAGVLPKACDATIGIHIQLGEEIRELIKT